MKILISIIFFIQILTAQKQSTNDNINEYRFFYSDSLNGKLVYGNYEPKDLIKLSDDSYLIGTEFSINFPLEIENKSNYSSSILNHYEKTHTSSGTVLKLNSQFKKEWEIIFKNQRVEKILKTTDSRILVICEDISMKYLVIREIDENGNIKWEKHLDYKNKVRVANAIINKADEIFILIEASHVIPLKIRKYYGKLRVKIFKDSEIDSHLALIKVSKDGKKSWLKIIDKDRKLDKFGINLATNQESIFATYKFEGKKNDSIVKGKKVIEISNSGKKMISKEIPKDYILFQKNDSIQITNQYSKKDFQLYESNIRFNNIRGIETLENGDSIIVRKNYIREKKSVKFIKLIRIKNGA